MHVYATISYVNWYLQVEIPVSIVYIWGPWARIFPQPGRATPCGLLSPNDSTNFDWHLIENDSILLFFFFFSSIMFMGLWMDGENFPCLNWQAGCNTHFYGYGRCTILNE